MRQSLEINAGKKLLNEIFSCIGSKIHYLFINRSMQYKYKLRL